MCISTVSRPHLGCISGLAADGVVCLGADEVARGEPWDPTDDPQVRVEVQPAPQVEVVVSEEVRSVLAAVQPLESRADVGEARVGVRGEEA